MSQTVLITGASQGIGKATAIQFIRHGYNVVMAARQRDRLDAAADDVRAQASSNGATSPGSVLPLPTDVREPDAVKALVDQTLSHYGAIDVLVNNAGIYISGPAETFTLEDWHTAIDTNLWGYIHTIYAVLPHFIQRQSGTIVNVGSIGGKVPVPYLVPYTTSKFAITGLTQALNTELAPKGIHVCGIYPNLIETNFMERAIFRGNDPADESDRRNQVRQILEFPLVEQPEEVAQSIWNAVHHQKNDVLVGTAKLAAITHQIAPQPMQWIMRKTFQNKD